jgi:hypothetical protein
MAKKKKPVSPSKPFIFTGAERTATMNVLKTTDAWSVYKLTDGTEIKAKPVIIHIKRVIGKFNQNGDPIYLVHAGMAVDTKVPFRLKKKR